MKHLFKNAFMLTFIILCISMMLTNTQDIMGAVNDAVVLWATKVFPVLFPFFIFTTLAIRLGVIHFIGEFLKPLTKLLFKTSSVSGFVVLFSVISGNPSSAIIITELLNEKMITKKEAQHLMTFTVFINPLFCIGTIGYSYFNNVSIGYIILTAHILGNIILGILLRFKANFTDDIRVSVRSAYQKMNTQLISNNKTIGEIVTDILQKGINTMFIICGFMIFFSILTRIMLKIKLIDYSFFILRPVLTLFNISYEIYSSVFIGMFEMVIGANYTIGQDIPLRSMITLLTMLISFGGFSIHSQINSILYKTKLKYAPFLLGRLAHMVISGILAYLIFPFFYKEVTSDVSLINRVQVPEKSLVLFTIITLIILTLLQFIHMAKGRFTLRSN
ncbi:nucleoside recognition domain-containing protein [Haloplasma contractile]|uniref:Nucleoside recognition domain protein n=1 Tax=Haloplasma contractile SSD-17B TaxID=1033810 RepID=U2EER1_9MOLU|nr:nucleoside recognition domain-containing protein [Haloplasma contractile]ERJ13448.1 Nucleoside recognition domain protein [Haloplasma contractile SSD-17B]